MLLYYITDRKAFPGTETQQLEALLRRVAEAARAGVDYIQLREKDLPAHTLERLAREAVVAIRSYSTTARLLINGRADVALAVGADGVHLPAGELTASEVRALWMRCSASRPLIGVSAHTAGDVRDAAALGADIAVLAPVFEKAQTHTPGMGLEALRAACAQLRHVQEAEASPQVRLALLALGGITIWNARSCTEAGAAGVAGIRLFQQGDVFDTVRRLKEL